MGVVFWGAVGFASPKKDAANHKNDGKGRTLTVVIKSREAAVVDVGEGGLSHGDMRVVNAPLYDEGGKHKVGRIDVYCVTTDPADEPEEEASMAECFLTYTLPGGEIDTQSVTTFPRLPAPPPKAIDAIRDRSPSSGTRAHDPRWTSYTDIGWSSHEPRSALVVIHVSSRQPYPDMSRTMDAVCGERSNANPNGSLFFSR